VSPEPRDPAAEQPGEPVRPEQPGASGAPEQPGEPEQPEHDDSGLDLARSIARSLARPGAKRRTGSGPTSGAASKFRPARRRVDTQASGAHPDERDPQLLDATMGRLVRDQGWGTDVRVHGVFSRWDTMVGREVAQHCTPESFDRTDAGGGKLVVRTDSTAWATQMKLLAPTVVRRLNEELGDGTVTLIEVLGPHGPSWKRGLRSVRDGRGPRDTYG
jgi:predicted nucleic acid-binding Zn ribbon protein